VLVTLVLVYWPWDAHVRLTDVQRKNRHAFSDLTCHCDLNELAHLPARVSVGVSCDRRLALAIGVAAFAVRPTSAVVLAYVGLRALWYYSTSERLRLVLCEVLPIGCV
jgi:hypothetical protein